MFEVTITSLREFHIFVKIIRGEKIEDPSDIEVLRLSQSLGSSADKLLAAEEANKAQGA